MELFMQCAALAVLAAVAAVVLRRHVPEIALVLVIAASVLLLGAVTGVSARILQFLRELATAAGIAPDVLAPLGKATAIAILTKLACDICRDAGAGSLATVVELCGCMITTMLSLPLLEAVMKLVSSFG